MTNIHFEKPSYPRIPCRQLKTGDKFIFNEYDSTEVWMKTDSDEMVSLSTGRMFNIETYHENSVIPVDLDIKVTFPTAKV